MTLATALFSRVLELVLCAWAFMLLVMIIHGYWLPVLPTIGYWASLGVVALSSAARVAIVGARHATT